jgi:hypothetical protein
MPQRSWSSWPFRAFPPVGAATPLGALWPSCRSRLPLSPHATTGAVGRCETGVTRRPRRLAKNAGSPFTTRGLHLAEELDFRASFPDSDQLHRRLRLGRRRALCSPGLRGSSPGCSPRLRLGGRRERRRLSPPTGLVPRSGRYRGIGPRSHRLPLGVCPGASWPPPSEEERDRPS